MYQRAVKVAASSMKLRLKIGKKAKQRECLTLEDPIPREIETPGGLNLG